MIIRPYSENDFEEICSWWRDHGEFPPLPGMMTQEGTFVVEYEGKAVMTLTVLMTQTKEISYFEGYCAKPGLDHVTRNQIGKILWEYGYNYLKQRGYRRVVAFTNSENLADRYVELGMQKCMTGIQSLGRVL